MALNVSIESYLALQSENDALHTALTEAESRELDLQEELRQVKAELKESQEMIPTTQPIVGGPAVAQSCLEALLKRHAPHLSEAERTDLAQAYTFYGEQTKVGNLIPFAQAVHESDWFISPRWVEQRNPAGLGATDDGAAGAHFYSITAGVQAQFAHLLAYALPAAPNEQCSIELEVLIKLDPRLDAVTAKGWRGAAPRWADLSSKWGSRPGYGERILKVARELVSA